MITQTFPSIITAEIQNLTPKYAESNWYAAILALRDTYEIAIKYSCLLLCAEIYRSGDDSVFRLLVNPERSMPLGDWCNDVIRGIWSSSYVQGDDNMRMRREAEKLLIHAETIMTVENLTAFNRMDLDGIFFVFLSGYHSRIKQKLIQMIAGENKDKTWMHVGDIDPDGFDIVRHLERSTGITFELYRMGCAELKKYQKYTKKLNQNDRAKTEELLKIERYRETVEYMMEHDCKLEQEIISWSESQKSAAKIKI